MTLDQITSDSICCLSVLEPLEAEPATLDIVSVVPKEKASSYPHLGLGLHWRGLGVKYGSLLCQSFREMHGRQLWVISQDEALEASDGGLEKYCKALACPGVSVSHQHWPDSASISRIPVPKHVRIGNIWQLLACVTSN